MHLLEKTIETPASAQSPQAISAETCAMIEAAFGVPFAILASRTGEVLHRGRGLPAIDLSGHGAVGSEVARRGKPELIEEHGPLLLLAIPWAERGGEYVAISPFVSRSVSPSENLIIPARSLGLATAEAAIWAAAQTPWSPDALLRMAELVQDKIGARLRVERLESDVEQLSGNINSTYEEISLLHRLTQNLRLSQSDEDLGRVALEWLEGIMPAEAVAISLVPAGHSESLGAGSPPRVFLANGNCSIDGEVLCRLAEYATEKFGTPGEPVVLNAGITSNAEWPCAAVRQAIFVPLAEGNHRFGWMAALNHADDAEFGSSEASLLNSVAVILGIHSGNILLYRQQAELTGGIIRALTEAIDAKDQYTCGHSDRVARIAVRLAQEMRCDLPTVNTIYLAGLLHDIGKIGITDDVLRKPGKLTPDEYEHIKTHTVIGHRILRDIKKLDQILPIILHHHESWNGAGYPMQLAADDIPLSARIVAVADSYDAMGSDRPYRKGLPEEKIEEIFRKESGVQWDPQVVDAFFRAREDLQAIVNDTRRDLQLDFRTLAD